MITNVKKKRRQVRNNLTEKQKTGSSFTIDDAEEIRCEKGSDDDEDDDDETITIT
jgi:hypothetical protein